MARSLAELAKEALEVQDACNLSGVAHGFSRAMHDLAEHVPGTFQRNTHPIAILWIDKMAELAGVRPEGYGAADTYGAAYHWAHEEMAK